MVSKEKLDTLAIAGSTISELKAALLNLELLEENLGETKKRDKINVPLSAIESRIKNAIMLLGRFKEI